METNHSIIQEGGEYINYFWFFYLSVCSYSFYQYYRIFNNSF